MATRRQFLRTGLAGGALLVATHWIAPLGATPRAGMRVLDAASANMLAALVPVGLEGSLPQDPAARERAVREVVEAFDRAIGVLSPAVRGEVQQLFSVLAFAPTRLAMAGLWSPLESASAGDSAAFLARWRHSRFDIQRSAYAALTQLIQAAWLDNPSAWPAIGYPGPPALP